MTTLRRDALRNRDRILAAARDIAASGEPLQLNAVARSAEVGVGTVYRHFGTPEALAEGLVEWRFTELTDAARAAADEPDAALALRAFLSAALEAYAADPLFADATVASTPSRPETVALRRELIGALAALVDRVSDRLRAGLDPADLMILMCGLGYAARLRPERGPQYLEAMLDGVLR
ncbi:TetR family transcriptional regulator [Leifsonia sp. F6_8S_P_1B]|uniref:TetR family transcriptional regulator n=1 Tax=Leifsonia williamsii TaxID=3035919 RepID=A0ABT8K6D9_9MICO|nr:TetR/AcrR family transcriptional regulator [Leifsonia williamsii]MDN4613010.1 TetR family transcriptional regulator [Leifsonia williamsii]